MTSPHARTPETTVHLLRICLLLAGLSGAFGVVGLALAAHSDTTGLMSTAAQMLLFHAPVFLGIGVLAQIRRAPVLPLAALLLLCGLGLFCGDLLCRVFLGSRLFPMSAPIGGMLLILSWFALALSAFALRERTPGA